MTPLWQLLLLVLLASVNSLGLDRDLTVAQLLHTAWAAKDGAPTEILSLAQSSDGYLWLGTSSGLVRFDGIHFEPYEPTFGRFPSRNVSAIMAAPDNGLWVGFRFGGSAFLKAGRAVPYSEEAGFSQGTVRRFARSTDGAIWAATGSGLMRFKDGHWKPIGTDWGYTARYASYLYVDHAGGVWAGSYETLFHLDPQSRMFRVAFTARPNGPTQIVSGLRGICQTADSVMWVVDSDRGLIALSGQRKLHSISILEPNESLVDRDDSLWISTAYGLARISSWSRQRQIVRPEASQRFAARDGLSDDATNDLLEDREGNIWVATQKGLDRFSRRIVVPMSFEATGFRAPVIVPDNDGSIWSQTFGGVHRPRLLRYSNGAVSARPTREQFTSAYNAPDGTLWFGGQDALFHYAKNRFQHVVMPPKINSRTPAEVQAITMDGHGDLWISVVRNGIFRLHSGAWKQYGGTFGLPRAAAVTLWTDPKGRVWLGYTDGTVVLLDGDRPTTLSNSNGLRVGSVTAIYGRDTHVWIGGEWGLAYLAQNCTRMFATWDKTRVAQVTGIAETPNGDLWLNEGAGVVQITADEISRTLRDPNHSPAIRLLDFRDGVLGRAPQIRPLPSAVLAKDGKVWLTCIAGVAWVDPKRSVYNPLPPPVSFRSLTVKGEPYQLLPIVKLPSLPSNIQIDYTALSLTAPERVRFHYQLEGFDKDWRDAGANRTAFYNNLGPGKYRFHVIAANNDGVWNTNGASFQIVVAPAYFQTWWFRACWVILAGLLLWVAYRARLRRLATQFNIRLEERVGERTRIARDLHDNLLQSFQGLMLRFQLVQKMLPDRPVEAQNALKIAIERATGAITEGRDAVHALRTSPSTRNELIPALTALGEEMSALYAHLSDERNPASFRLLVEGSAPELHPILQDDLFRIAREAVANAFRHARANNIEVEVRFDERGLRLRVRDDGIGVESRVAAAGREGHWGLPGMRERAKKIGARFELWTEAGAGTEIEIVVPEIVAYRENHPTPRLGSHK